MTPFLGGLISKAFALAILAGIILLAYVVVVAPIADGWAASSRQIEEKRAELGHLTAALRAPEQRAAVGETEIHPLNFSLLEGESDQIRAASLQARVDAVAANEGIRLSSVTVLPPRMENGLRLVGIEVQVQTGMKQLQSLLYTLETQKPPLFVGMLQISRAPDSAVRGGALDTRMTLFGATAKGKGG